MAASEGLFEAIATGEIQLDIDDIAEITLTGGEESARAEAARLQIKWAAEAEPVLRRAGLASLDDVLVATKGRTRSVEEIQRLRQAAAALDQRIADQRDWGGALAERRRDLANAEAGLAGKDRQKLETVALKLRIDDLEATEALLTELNAQRPKLIERERILGGELFAARALIAEKQKELVTACEELRAAQSGVEGYSRELLSQLLDEQSQFASRLIKAEQELRTLDADIDGALADASGALEIAEREHRAAEAAHREIAEELRTAESKEATAEGELRILGEVAAKLDESEARQAFVAMDNAAYIFRFDAFEAQGVTLRTHRFELKSHLKFEKTHRIIHNGDWEQAAAYMLSSEFGIRP